jgi:hypothetical protein
MRRPIVPLLLLALTTSCSRRESEAPQPVAQLAPPAASVAAAAIRHVAMPSAAASVAPRLSRAGDGSVMASWLEPAEEGGHALRFSTWSNGTFGSPSTVIASSSLIANWADRPGVMKLPDGRLLAWWDWSANGAEEGYSIRVALSSDAGVTWSAPLTPHRDRGPGEHGFVAAWPTGDDVTIAWLDGRDLAKEGGEGHLMITTIAAGVMSPERVLDPRACECCPTSVVRAGDVTLLAYRDRSPEEERDIAVIRQLKDGTLTPSALVHRDQWPLRGCPVNGPSIDARGAAAVVAWFTEASLTPRVLAAFSTDAGATWGEPIAVDAEMPAGHADVVMLDDGSAAVLWAQHAQEGEAVVLRRVMPDGRVGKPLTLDENAQGLPQIERVPEGLLVVYATRASTPPGLGAQVVPLDALPAP